MKMKKVDNGLVLFINYILGNVYSRINSFSLHIRLWWFVYIIWFLIMLVGPAVQLLSDDILSGSASFIILVIQLFSVFSLFLSVEKFRDSTTFKQYRTEVIAHRYKKGYPVGMVLKYKNGYVTIASIEIGKALHPDTYRYTVAGTLNTYGHFELEPPDA